MKPEFETTFNAANRTGIALLVSVLLHAGVFLVTHWVISRTSYFALITDKPVAVMPGPPAFVVHLAPAPASPGPKPIVRSPVQPQSAALKPTPAAPEPVKSEPVEPKPQTATLVPVPQPVATPVPTPEPPPQPQPDPVKPTARVEAPNIVNEPAPTAPPAPSPRPTAGATRPQPNVATSNPPVGTGPVLSGSEVSGAGVVTQNLTAAAGPLPVYVEPRYRTKRVPVYPANARRLGWSGQVTLHVEIDQEGKVTAVSVVESSGYPTLDDAAMASVRRSRFYPALLGGIPVASSARVPVEFVK